MIKTVFGITDIAGSKPMVKADLIAIIAGIKKEVGLSKDEIIQLVNKGLDAADQSEDVSSAEKTEDAALELLKKLTDLMDEVLKKGDKKDE